MFRIIMITQCSALIKPSLLSDQGVVLSYLSPIRPFGIRLGRTSVYAQYTLICSDRETIQTKLKQVDIHTAAHYSVPLNELAVYKYLSCPDCTPIASRLAKKMLSLPTSLDLTFDQQEKPWVFLDNRDILC